MEINGKCGKRTYDGFSKLLIDDIIHKLQNNGVYVSEENPWTVVTHRCGIVLQGNWNAQEETLDIIVLKKNFDVSCKHLWETIDHLIDGIRSGIQNLDIDTAV